MDLNNVIALCNAGFSKEEILALTSAPGETPKAEPKEEKVTIPTETTKEEVLPIPVPSTKEAQPASDKNVTLSNDQFTQLIQSLNQSGASVDVPPKYDINQTLAEHYKSLMNGQE